MYKALIVDDEQMIREDLQDFVGWKEAGFTEVHQAGNGAQALKIAADIRFDLVLADINMPGMNGIEMIRRLREQGCQAAMVVITAYGEFEYAKQAISLGVKEYVLKPIDFGELQALVSRIAGQLRATTEEERNRQFVREAELACAELLESAALLRREKAEEAVERLFAAQHAPHGREAGLIYALGDKADELIAAMGWWVEAGTPFPEGGVAVGDRLQSDRGHIAHQRQRRLQQTVTQPALLVRQRQQLLAQFSAIRQPEAAHGSHSIDGIPALDLAEGDGRMPAVVAVEVPQDCPDIADGGVDDRAAADFHHQPVHPARFARSPIVRPEVSGRSAA